MKKRYRWCFALIVLVQSLGGAVSADPTRSDWAPRFGLTHDTASVVLPVQGMPFQPVLLAIDQKAARLFAAVPGKDSAESSLLFFSRPELARPRSERLFSLVGVASGLSYDAEGGVLVVSNATEREVNLFDHFDPKHSLVPNRTLRGFNFPTGIGFDRGTQRLFVADAHPGAVLVFENLDAVRGAEPPALTLGAETGLNGPFAVVCDPLRGRFYVSNFDGVFVFRLDVLSAPPVRVPLPEGTLARGLALDSQSGRLYIAAPMRRSYFMFDGDNLEETELRGVTGAFPFSLALDVNSNRLYLAGTEARIGVINRAEGSHLPKKGPEVRRRGIDRWIDLNDAGLPRPPKDFNPPDIPFPPGPFHPSPPRPMPPRPMPEGPSVIDFKRASLP